MKYVLCCAHSLTPADGTGRRSGNIGSRMSRVYTLRAHGSHAALRVLSKFKRAILLVSLCGVLLSGYFFYSQEFGGTRRGDTTRYYGTSRFK